MAALSDADRLTVARDYAQKIHVRNNNLANCAHDTLKAAVDAADDWADANAAAYNTALPVAYRNTANTAQKTVLLALVILRRAGIEVF